jgi:CubicO group peptidase (beta-lactamase class C family)
MAFRTAAVVLLTASAAQAAAQGPAPRARPPAAVVSADTTKLTHARLERVDVEAWLDGFMPYALAAGDIAGGVVVVVKDGAVLLQKGYGFSDVERRKLVAPDSTLFRAGSVSKLFTWTAVMQLVEEGKLELDRDVNAYLDFVIPAYDGKPITLRNIMTHTPGFEESVRYLIGDDSTNVIPLERLMKIALPKRVFAPGTTPAYSNYAVSLAGYIVARVSGQPFDERIEKKVFQPLGMTRSTFRQPLPADLKPLMSQGYVLGSGDPKPFEIVQPAPAGSVSATGADMAKFMIAHLNGGAGILRPETARLMHTTTLTIVPPLNRMALGFYEQNINGRRVISHGGDTQWFHSYLWLFPDDRVGLFVSVNSAGREGASGLVRDALFTEFADRYFPSPLPDTRVDSATAAAHARMMSGVYSGSRGSFTNFMRVVELFSQTKLSVDDKGKLVAPALTGTNHQPLEWVEIAPFVWRDENSGMRLAAKVENNHVVRWSVDSASPFLVFDPTPWYRSSAWLVPALSVSLGVVLLTALAWPLGAIVRRRYKVRPLFEGRALWAQRLTAAFAWLAVIALVLWGVFVSIGFGDLPKLGGSLDWLLKTAQILTPIALFGLLLVVLLNLTMAWRRGWFAKVWNVALTVSAIVILWVVVAFRLLGRGTYY